MRLENYKIIVTGGAGGIGGGTVRSYVKEGAAVAVIDIRDEEGEAVVKEANELAQGPGYAKYYHCDVGNPDEVFPVFEQIIEELGGLDCLAHLAAYDSDRAKPEDYTPEMLKIFWATNIDGTIFTNQAAYKHFQKTNKGSIINYASDVGLNGSAWQAAYATSKGANLAWTRTIADVWAREHNVRANAICPHVMTRLYKAYIDDLPDAEREVFKEQMKGFYPMTGWPGDADRDAGPLMVFLASDESMYINKQTICLSGGAGLTR